MEKKIHKLLSLIFVESKEIDNIGLLVIEVLNTISIDIRIQLLDVDIYVNLV